MRGLQSGIGLSEGGGKRGERKIVQIMANLAEKGLDVRGLVVRANSPIRFMLPIASPSEIQTLPVPNKDFLMSVVLACLFSLTIWVLFYRLLVWVRP